MIARQRVMNQLSVVGGTEIDRLAGMQIGLAARNPQNLTSKHHTSNTRHGFAGGSSTAKASAADQ